MSKYNLEFKLKVIKEYLEGNIKNIIVKICNIIYFQNYPYINELFYIIEINYEYL